LNIVCDKNSKLWLAIFSASSIVINSAAANLAQAQTPAQKAYPPTKTATGSPMPKAQRKGGSTTPPNDWPIEPMKEKVDLPNLPEFTGHAKFTMGTMHPTDKGPSYVMHFAAKEDHKLILDWYKNTLHMYGWRITFADGQVVTAENKNANCAVSVNDCTGRRDGNNSDIEIDYAQRNK
jgi:hypothetical protein